MFQRSLFPAGFVFWKQKKKPPQRVTCRIETELKSKSRKSLSAPSGAVER